MHTGTYGPSATLEQIVHAAAAGDELAWSHLMQRFDRRIRGVARQHRLAGHDVEDVVQTTWLRLVQHIRGVRDPESVGAWLHTTARRESLGLLGGSRRELPSDDLPDQPSLEPSCDEQLSDAEAADAVRGALRCLPERQRALVHMLFDDAGPSYDEISRALDMPVGSIGPIRARCLKRLRGDVRLASAVA